MSKTYSQIYLHIVFSPRYRQSLIVPEVEFRLYGYIAGIIANLNQTLIRINGMPDHLHILVRLRPNIAPSTFIQKVKANSSKWVNEQGFFSTKFSWQQGSGVFSVSYRSVSTLIRYIENQKSHHTKKAFKEEYISILHENNVDFDQAYLPDFHD